MGLNAIKLADMENYINVVMVDPTLNLINLDDPIAALGPRAMSMTAKLKAGWISFMLDADSTLSA
jgi:hypothetical protein